ncbi:hypothetical protein NLZ15_22725 (plasmid) [Atlantibacter subterranea]|uniref:hypothetical protein n=1 Tax=Atlantibacter subterraneus TaxID=255519 RepID=UPI0020C50C54|nr:hypothetical protein [Atlantibacter subterranea]UTJ49790.1 hypothetical protein NLZ15_22725 [Atlantibacter subterranea]
MPQFKEATPHVSVRLYKTISRKTVDGQAAVSTRYAGKDEYIDLTPFLGDGSSVVTRKSVREPAGGFSITFADKPKASGVSAGVPLPGGSVETVYGLVEPMDVVEIRMWSGIGPKPAVLPIKMRGFVSKIGRSQSMTQDGKPVRAVVVSGQDYGKIWQTYQVLYLSAYDGTDAFLTAFNMWERFGIGAQNTMAAGDFVRAMVEKVLNPHIKGFMPRNSPMPKELKLDVSVRNGVVNNSYQSQQGSVYDVIRTLADVGVWNELYIEDREDGTYVVYRPMPALHVTKPVGAKDRKIQPDAPDPIYVTVADEFMQSINAERSDENVANFFWVNNQRYDLIDDIFRKQAAVVSGDPSVSTREYPNTAVQYYGIRPMYAETQQAANDVSSMTTGLDASTQEQRSGMFTDWLDNRRQIMMAMNRDNVVLEVGTARIKGGLTRPAGKDGKAEHMKAGDYALFRQGNLQFEGYITEITDEFIPFLSYTATIQFERGTGFVERAKMEGGVNSPWLAEQATRSGDQFSTR